MKEQIPKELPTDAAAKEALKDKVGKFAEGMSFLPTTEAKEQHRSLESLNEELITYLQKPLTLLGELGAESVNALRDEIAELDNAIEALPRHPYIEILAKIVERWLADEGDSTTSGGAATVKVELHELELVRYIISKYAYELKGPMAAIEELTEEADKLKQRMSEVEQAAEAFASVLPRIKRLERAQRVDDISARAIDTGLALVATAGIGAPLAADLFGESVTKEIAVESIELGATSGLILVVRLFFRLVKSLEREAGLDRPSECNPEPALGHPRSHRISNLLDTEDHSTSQVLGDAHKGKSM